MNLTKISASGKGGRDYYDTCFQEYHRNTFNIDPTKFLSVLTNHLTGGASILDIGCGSGRDLLWLKNKGYKPTGFERSQNLAELARKNSGCRVVNGDFTRYDFSGYHYDALLLVGALVHLPHPELFSVLLRASSALKQRGIIYLSMKEGIGQSHTKDGRVFILWQCEQLEKIFLDLGFVILDFVRNKSVLKTGEVWLSYLLAKERNI
ncbi:MAG: class I SAM-dependent methyltransferase [Desulfobulbaceae bacterium]|nr:class I SAM-dependent methyltransferase [Desulfobulbaceae bacterium]